MAKGKHATALFEVIQSDKRFQKDASSAGGILRTPKWWFKGRAKPQRPEPQEPEQAESGEWDPTRRPLVSPLTAAPAPAPLVPEPAPVDVAPVAVSPAPVAAVREPQPPAVEAADVATGEPASRGAQSLAGLVSRTGVQMKLDPDRHEIALRVRYNTAIITAFGVLVLIGLAYVTGRHTGRGPAPAMASLPTEELRRQQPRPQVLDVGGKPAPTWRQNVVTAPPAGARSPAPAPVAQRLATAPDVAAAGVARTVGLNYVVVQSYPERKAADEAAALLAQSGIDCTVEHGLPRLNPNWYVVVGTEGFAKVSSPDFQAYTRHIQKVSTARTATQRNFKPFDPMGYKWDRPGR